MHARDFHRRDTSGKTKFFRTCNLPWLHALDPPHFLPKRAFGREHMPSTTPLELAAAIIDCIDAGAHVINLSLALAHPSTKGEQALEESLNQAVRRGVLIIAAAGNQSTLGSSVLRVTRGLSQL
jgi:subtilisin family serine protease